MSLQKICDKVQGNLPDVAQNEIVSDESEIDMDQGDLPDVAQKETVSDESEIDMQRDNMLEQLDRVQKTIDSFSMFLTLDQVQNISDEMNVLECMIQLLH